MAKRTPTRRTFLDPAKIDATLTEVRNLAARSNTAIALAGGCAMQLYGSDRFTQDVDIVADGRVGGLTPKGKLSFGGMRTAASNGVTVDIILRADQYAGLYVAALAAARRLAGVAVPVVTLPYLAAMKMAAGRGKDEQDLEFILCDSGSSWPAIRKVIAEHLGVYAAEEAAQTRDIAKWKRSK